MAEFLERNLFKTIVEKTPLISIDFVIENKRGHILLGKRLNLPARNYWFVPGGRIRKDETISSAFTRLALDELNVKATFDSANFIAPYEHFYTDNFSGDDFSTHYVVLAYKLNLDIDLSQLPNKQHDNYNWFEIDQLLSSPDVHENTKNYFLK